MIFIVPKIKSITDVITNSSSETFLMSYAMREYEGVTNEEITWDKIYDMPYWWEEIVDYLKLDKNLLTNYKVSSDYYGYFYDKDKGKYYGYPLSEDWKIFVDIYKKEFETLIGMYIVDISNHYEDYEDARSEAKSYCECFIY